MTLASKPAKVLGWELQDVRILSGLAEEVDMGIVGRLLRSLFFSAISMLVVLAMVWHFLPKDSSLKSASRLLVDYRRGTANPVALKILDLLMSEDQRLAADRSEGADARNFGRGSASVGDQLEGATEEDIVTFTGNAYDPTTFETIEKMNVSEEIKRELRRNYLRTGELPGAKLALGGQAQGAGEARPVRAARTSAAEAFAGAARAARGEPSPHASPNGAKTKLIESVGGALEAISTTE